MSSSPFAEMEVFEEELVFYSFLGAFNLRRASLTGILPQRTIHARGLRFVHREKYGPHLIQFFSLRCDEIVEDLKGKGYEVGAMKDAAGGGRHV